HGSLLGCFSFRSGASKGRGPKRSRQYFRHGSPVLPAHLPERFSRRPPRSGLLPSAARPIGGQTTMYLRLFHLLPTAATHRLRCRRRELRQFGIALGLHLHSDLPTSYHHSQSLTYI